MWSRKNTDPLQKTELGIWQSCPKGGKLVNSKWVFQVKCKVDGDVDHYKARLVVRGSFQIHSVDFDKTYAPLAKFVSIKTLLTYVTTLHLEIHKMDVSNTFLNGQFMRKFTCCIKKDLRKQIFKHVFTN
jgi:hypothetical protein